MGIGISQRGSFKNIEKFFRSASTLDKRKRRLFEKYGREGVTILSKNTPVETGLTANSWYYEIIDEPKGLTVSWNNSNVKSGAPVVILIHYGHATKNGGYVKGVDFINPALRPIFNKLSEDLWREVVR